MKKQDYKLKANKNKNQKQNKIKKQIWLLM